MWTVGPLGRGPLDAAVRSVQPPHHRVEPVQLGVHRQAFIESFGIRIVRFLNGDVYEDLDAVLGAIAREISERRRAIASPPYEEGIEGDTWDP